MISINIGEIIKQLRHDKNISARELARRSDISQGYLSQLETGKNNNPTNEMLIKIANGLGVPYIRLLRTSGYFEDDVEISDKQDVFPDALNFEGMDELSINKINTDIALGKVFTLDPDQRLSYRDSQTVASIMTKTAFLLFHGPEQWGTEPLMNEINDMISNLNSSEK